MKRLVFWIPPVAVNILGVMGFTAAITLAQDVLPKSDIQSQQISAEQIAEWIRQLDADDFQSRESASESLARAGMAALQPLAEAAQASSLEVTTRTMDILTKLYERSGAEDQAKVKVALEAIAAGKNKAAASRADAILNPPQPEQPAIPGFGPRGVNRGINFAFGGRNLQVSSTTDANGNKTVNAKEGDKEVDIEEKADGSIKMTVKEKIDGKQQSKEYSAKSKEELKEKHKEAFDLYEKYTNQMNGIMIRPLQFAKRMPPMPAIPGFRIFNPGEQQAAMQAITEAQKELKSAASALRKMTAGDGKPITADAVKELLRQIEAAEKKIEEASKKMGG
ncbi:MAG: hypothetical protein MPJ50_15495 [Pirellulales bacterium]|nr:hypothetical protein [Pirellulales bacterium]